MDRRTFITTAGATVVSVGLAGCGDQPEENNGETTPTESGGKDETETEPENGTTTEMGPENGTEPETET